MSSYIIRLDDACPTMDKIKWNRILLLLDKYDIKPIIAVVPNNQDSDLIVNEDDKDFWNIVKKWTLKGYHIAMHGYNHKFISNNKGLVPLNKYSEFAGVAYNIQKEKIISGLNIFQKNDIQPKIWVAPAHSFDKNTLDILKKETEIRIISDGISQNIFNQYGFIWIPQQLWKFEYKTHGVWTICLHPNNMNEQDFQKLEKHLEQYHKLFDIDLEILIDKYKNYTLEFTDSIFRVKFFIKRRVFFYLSKIKRIIIR